MPLRSRVLVAAFRRWILRVWILEDMGKEQHDIKLKVSEDWI